MGLSWDYLGFPENPVFAKNLNSRFCKYTKLPHNTGYWPRVWCLRGKHPPNSTQLPVFVWLVFSEMGLCVQPQPSWNSLLRVGWPRLPRPPPPPSCSFLLCLVRSKLLTLYPRQPLHWSPACLSHPYPCSLKDKPMPQAWLQVLTLKEKRLHNFVGFCIFLNKCRH